ncbi:MAG: ATP-binding cassette domain-containing protein [Candidatus Eiseniibacteriota bacterium]
MSPGPRAPGPAGPNGDVVLRVAGLERSFGTVEAVRGVDLEIRRGEMFGFIGPDGAGKTSTLRMIAGLLAPDGGHVETLGLDPRRDRRALSRRLGYLAQRFSLYGDLTVDENLEFFAEIQGVRDLRKRCDEMLELVRLAPFRRRLADRLSGGMKQKLALACTLVHTPELLLLDEPTTGVDPVSRRDFWRLLAEIRMRKITIVVSTPYLDEAERCTRIALFSRGRVLGVDAPDAMRAGAGGGWHELIASPRRAAERTLAALPGVHDLEAFGERLHFRLDPPLGAPQVRAALATAEIEVLDLREVPASLEDVFLSRIRADVA